MILCSAHHLEKTLWCSNKKARGHAACVRELGSQYGVAAGEWALESGALGLNLSSGSTSHGTLGMLTHFRAGFFICNKEGVAIRA